MKLSVSANTIVLVFDDLLIFLIGIYFAECVYFFTETGSSYIYAYAKNIFGDFLNSIMFGINKNAFYISADFYFSCVEASTKEVLNLKFEHNRSNLNKVMETQTLND